MNVRSIRWTLPASSRGIGYAGNSCSSTATGAVQGARAAMCFNYSIVLRSAKWVLGTGARRRDVFARAATDDEDCQKPNEYTYYSEGKKQIVTKKIPADKADEVLKWIEDGNWEKIEELEEAAENADL